MFKLVKAPHAWWPVEFETAGEDGGLVAHRFELRFRLLKVDEAIAFIREAMAAADLEGEAEGQKRAEIYAGLVERVAVDWRDIQAENGEPLPWAADNLRTLMNEPGMFVRVFRAFQACLAGRDAIRSGN